MSLEVINTPLFVTTQDMGRFDYVHLGVSVSGVMDEYSYLIANTLLDNPKDTNIIEINFSNISFLSHINTNIAITGALCEFFINDIACNIWQSYSIKKGDIIEIGKIISGTRVYLAVKGGFDIPKELGSSSTTIKESIGGLDGNKLKKGDILGCSSTKFFHNKRLKKTFIPQYKDELELRVILSYQEAYFTQSEKEKFFTKKYIVTNEISRMGYKLTGEPIKCDLDGIISEGISFGAIQIPNNGQPIILLKERQTIGGYPKIGVVLDVDCFKLSQAKPNTKIRFKEISLEDGIYISKKFYGNLLI